MADENRCLTYTSRIAKETGLSLVSVSKVIKPLVRPVIVVEKPLGKQSELSM